LILTIRINQREAVGEMRPYGFLHERIELCLAIVSKGLAVGEIETLRNNEPLEGGRCLMQSPDAGNVGIYPDALRTHSMCLATSVPCA
jgi:hypothetical protein